MDKKYEESCGLVCPDCGKEATANELVMDRKHGPQALTSTYFSCADCRLMFVSRRLIRAEISCERKGSEHFRKVPLSVLCGEVYRFVEESIVPYYKKIGYRLVRFRMRTPPC